MRALFLPRVFFGQTKKQKKEGDFDERNSLVCLMRKRRKKKTCRLFPHSKRVERVRETIIVSSSAAAAWHKVVVVVVEVEMA